MFEFASCVLSVFKKVEKKSKGGNSLEFHLRFQNDLLVMLTLYLYVDTVWEWAGLAACTSKSAPKFRYSILNTYPANVENMVIS